mmetsp:Transcript_46021/g.127813  ORF Transcript_46021/g.127813 Transcript_46021/m.127813 type:complete len:344 (-) Transcript_46021:77-1108(-)|eukprot:CAMPEP_0117500788 /NCGR_PEP_ID=MMETSP0784-20121206/22959_1 /TAXON_ID=39447 /ORGANISM="" /LENGTH=343 /DNA_ID=CAMNT_0005296013 /DNA_START=42 /DNA_END=1073 /DNA_ORIENTATION=-
MADRSNEFRADKETAALKKLQAAAGLVDAPQVERLDWMYEQSAVQQKKTDEELMNTPVSSHKDKDLEDVKKLQDSTAGSLFLKSSNTTTEDMLRKIREDPLYQIKREEQNARASMMANPLIMARIKQKEAKAAKKQKKKAKKAAKKEKKAQKKAEKKAKKAAKKKSSSDSSSSDSDSGTGLPLPRAGVKRSASPEARRPPRAEADSARTDTGLDDRALGPSSIMVNKREEYAALVAQRRDAALASRGAPRRMDEEAKRRKLEQMKADAEKHDKHKDDRIADAERRQKEQDDKEAKMRANSDQSYFREIRKDAYTNSDQSMAERLKTQRHRRAKNLNDPLERDQ